MSESRPHHHDYGRGQYLRSYRRLKSSVDGHIQAIYEDVCSDGDVYASSAFAESDFGCPDV